MLHAPREPSPEGADRHKHLNTCEYLVSEMGIKHYLTDLSEHFPGIYQAPAEIDVLCIDLNTALHPICAHSPGRAEFKRNLCGYLDRVLRQRRPRQLAVFSDGQAVLAKASIQMKRRQKHLYDADDDRCISTLNITPGTPFMHFIDEVIVEYLGARSIPHHYSPSTEPNEGEIKLFQWLKRQARPDQNVCIIGDDADLIVLSLLNAPLLRVYIYTQKQFISIARLVEGLSTLCDRSFGLANHPIRRDVGLISLLLGNDYVGPLVRFKPALAGYRAFLRDKTGFLTGKHGQVNWGNFRRYVMKLERGPPPPTRGATPPRPDEAAIAYLTALEWNMRLYTGDVIPNFLPENKCIGVSTLQQHFPRRVAPPSIEPAWLHPDVYLLLLMPIVGRRYLPESLQAYMSDDSPIRHLFPDPCDRCVGFKRLIGDINARMESMEPSDFRVQIAAANAAYRQHLDAAHPSTALPIQPIQDALFGPSDSRRAVQLSV